MFAILPPELKNCPPNGQVVLTCVRCPCVRARSCCYSIAWGSTRHLLHNPCGFAYRLKLHRLARGTVQRGLLARSTHNTHTHTTHNGA